MVLSEYSGVGDFAMAADCITVYSSSLATVQLEFEQTQLVDVYWWFNSRVTGLPLSRRFVRVGAARRLAIGARRETHPDGLAVQKIGHMRATHTAMETLCPRRLENQANTSPWDGAKYNVNFSPAKIGLTNKEFCNNLSLGYLRLGA